MKEPVIQARQGMQRYPTIQGVDDRPEKNISPKTRISFQLPRWKQPHMYLLLQNYPDLEGIYSNFTDKNKCKLVRK